jgi:hypothetical protein
MVAPSTVRELGKMTRFDAKNGKLGSQYAGYVTLFADLQGGILATGLQVWSRFGKRVIVARCRNQNGLTLMQ